MARPGKRLQLRITVMLGNSAPSLETRLDELRQAIKHVYATTFFRGAREYLRNANRRTEEEKMAVVIQQLVGRRYEDRFYPHCSGVAHSYDYYAVGDARPEDGVAHIALGFGQIIVEGGSFVRFCPKHPQEPSRWPTNRNLLKTDTEKGLDEFRRLNRNFHRVRVLSANMRSIPLRLPLTHLMFRFPRLMKPVLRLLDDGIPGYDRHWSSEMMVGRKKL